MSRPLFISEKEWDTLCKPDDEPLKTTQYVDVIIPYKLHQLAREKYGLKYNPATNTNYAPIEMEKYYKINYLTNFQKYSKKLNEKFTWCKIHACYYWVQMEGEQ